jgi:hypothetical protein
VPHFPIEVYARTALADAIADVAAPEFARVELGAIPALSRRRLLAAYTALMSARQRRRSTEAPAQR